LTEPDPAHLAEVLATEPPPARVYRPLNPAVAARIRAEAQARGYPHASDGSSVIIDGQNYRPRQLCQRWGIDFITRGGLYDYTPPPAPATPQEHYRTPQLDPALALPPGIVVIQSPMGSGKTHLIFQHLVRHLHDHPEARVLFVTYRIALAYEICRAARAHNLAVMNYDVEGREVDPATCQLFVTTVNSLHKLAQSPDLPTYDITVIDEMEGVCEHLCGATLAQGEQARNARNLVEHFIQTSAQVIAADAYISTVSYNFLNRHRGPHPKPHFILNTCPPTKERITFTSHAEALQDELVADLQQGQTVLVLSDSLRYAQQLYQRLAHRGFNLHLITSENSRDPANLSLLEQLGQGDPLPGQGLICSPVLGAGFDVQSPIATVYAFFSNQSITPEAQMQMLGRARQAQTAKCYVAYRTTPYETDRAAIYHELHLDYTQTRLSLQASGHYAPRWEKGHLELAHDELALIELQVDVERKHRCQGLTPFECLLAYARQFYREVTFATPDPHPSQVVVRAEMHAIRQARQAAEDVAILAADPVAPATWQHAQATGTATPELKAGHHKQEIMAGYGVAAEAVTAELIHDWQTGGLERLQRFVDMSLPIEAITARDWLQVEQNVPVIHRDHALSTYILFGALLQTIFGDTLHTHKIPAAELFERLKVFQHLFERFEAHTHFKRGHTASKNPMAWFRHILSLYGLRLQRHRPGKGHRNENNTYQLCPKSLAKMLAKANQLRAAQGLPPLEAEAIRLEGGQHLGLFQSLAVKPRYRVVQRRSPPP
jgi:superfamily II DNA or RNA helicase